MAVSSQEIRFELFLVDELIVVNGYRDVFLGWVEHEMAPHLYKAISDANSLPRYSIILLSSSQDHLLFPESIILAEFRFPIYCYGSVSLNFYLVFIT